MTTKKQILNLCQLFVRNYTVIKRWSRKLSYSSMVQMAHNKLYKYIYKKRTVIARRLNFLGIYQGIYFWSEYTVVFYHYKTLKAATAGIVVLTPPIFLKAKNFTYSLSPSLLTLLAKTYKNKNHCKGQFKENWSKKKKKRLLIACNEAAMIVYQNLSITAKVGVFLAAAEALLICYELTYLLNVLPE